MILLLKYQWARCTHSTFSLCQFASMLLPRTPAPILPGTFCVYCWGWANRTFFAIRLRVCNRLLEVFTGHQSLL